MGISRLSPLLAAALLWPCAQAQESIQQDGAYWVRTSKGTLGAPRSSLLRIRTSGRLALRGGSTGSEVTYQLKERLRVKEGVRARALLGDVKRPSPDFLVWMIAPAASDATSELEVHVPRSVTSAILETRFGDIEAYDLEGDVRAGTVAGAIQCDRIGGSVIARTGGGEIRLGQTGGAVRCFSGGGSILIGNAGGEVNCQTAGGDIVVREAGGPVALTTGGGNIHVGKAAASVQARSEGGVIEVGEAGGVVAADTGGGSIQVGLARGVRGESAAGAIRVKTSAGPLDLSTAMGSVVAELLAGGGLEDSSLVAGAGDVTVLIPSHLALSVMARSDSGGNPRIVSDFSEIRAHRFGFAPVPLAAQGAINGGGPMLRISVAGGTIYLRKVK